MENRGRVGTHRHARKRPYGLKEAETGATRLQVKEGPRGPAGPGREEERGLDSRPAASPAGFQISGLRRRMREEWSVLLPAWPVGFFWQHRKPDAVARPADTFPRGPWPPWGTWTLGTWRAPRRRQLSSTRALSRRKPSLGDAEFVAGHAFHGRSPCSSYKQGRMRPPHLLRRPVPDAVRPAVSRPPS